MKTTQINTFAPFFSAFLLMGMFLGSGCSTTQVGTKEIQRQQESMLPVNFKTTGNEDRLKDLGRMVGALGFGTQEVHIDTSSQAANDGKVPRHFTAMLRTALSKTGRFSVVSPTNTDIDTAYKTSSRKLINSPDWRLVKSDLDIIVAVSGLDKVYKKGHSLETDITFMGDSKVHDSGAEIGTESEASIITIDMSTSIYDPKSGKVAQRPGVYASTSFYLRKRKIAGGFGMVVEGKGGGYDGFREETDGLHEALRRMIELSLIQVIGRHYTVPYWNLIDGLGPDAFVVNAVRTNYERLEIFNPISLNRSARTIGFAHSIGGITIESDSLTEAEWNLLKQHSNVCGSKSEVISALHLTVPLDSGERVYRAIARQKLIIGNQAAEKAKEATVQKAKEIAAQKQMIAAKKALEDEQMRADLELTKQHAAIAKIKATEAAQIAAEVAEQKKMIATQKAEQEAQNENPHLTGFSIY